MDTVPSNIKPDENKSDLWLAMTLCYFAFPNFIFLLGWIRPAFGLPASLLVAFSLVSLLRKQDQKSFGRTLELRWKTRAIIFLATMAWVIMSGCGALVPQSMDYAEHNFIYHDLAHEQWPVIFEGKAGQSFFCYAVAYFLPTGLGMKFLGDAVGPWLSFFWTALGVGLFFFWIARRHPSSVKYLLLVLFYASTGLLWYVIKGERLQFIPHFENPSLPIRTTDAGLLHSYLDFATKFACTPQHALTGTLGAALLYELLWIRKQAFGAGFAIGCTLLWSPLTALGLMIIPCVSALRIRFSEWFSLPNILGGGTLLMVVAIYFQAHSKLDVSGPGWTFPNARPWPLLYVMFLVFQLSSLGILFLIDAKYRVLGEQRIMFWGASLMLVLLPVYRLGAESDLRLQAATPSFVIVGMATAATLLQYRLLWKKTLFLMLVSVYLVGMIYPVMRPVQNLFSVEEVFGDPVVLSSGKAAWYEYSASRLRRNLTSSQNVEGYQWIHEHQGCNHLTELHKDYAFDFGNQYIGRTNSPAWRFLLRIPQPPPGT